MSISVLITSYNQSRYIAETINSVLDQTMRPTQIVIVDDCSTDGSQSILDGYASKYPHLISVKHHPQNTGVAQARNDALADVSGELVTILDGDDRFLPNKLEKESRALRCDPDASLAFSDFYYLSNGERAGRWAEHEHPPAGNVFQQVFAREFPSRTLFRSEMVRYAAWQRVGFFDCTPPLWEDYDMRIRLSKELRTVYVPEPLSDYRIHNTGLSSRTSVENQMLGLRYVWGKNSHLLNDLPDSRRRHTRVQFNSFVSDVARQFLILSSNDTNLKVHERRYALKCYLHAVRADRRPNDFIIGLQLLLPRMAYSMGRHIYHASAVIPFARRSQ